MTDSSPEPARRRMSDTRYRLLVAGALAVAALALIAAIRTADTSDEPPPSVAARPDVVEHLFPSSGDQVLRQTELGIDLAAGYEGTLIVNGQPIPDDELRRVPEQNQVFYLPGEGTTFEELPGGTNCITAVVWKSSQGPGVDDETVRWCFEAA